MTYFVEFSKFSVIYSFSCCFCCCCCHWQHNCRFRCKILLNFFQWILTKFCTFARKVQKKHVWNLLTIKHQLITLMFLNERVCYEQKLKFIYFKVLNFVSFFGKILVWFLFQYLKNLFFQIRCKFSYKCNMLFMPVYILQIDKQM